MLGNPLAGGRDVSNGLPMTGTAIDNSREYQDILASASARICVIAGPGSGKTKNVLVPKAKRLISNPEVGADEVLMITFSRLSAKDLKDQLRGLPRVPRACTLHSFCLSFLLSENNHGIRSRIGTIVLPFEERVMICDLAEIIPGTGKRRLTQMLSRFSAGWATQPHDSVFNEDDGEIRFKAAVVNWLGEYEAAMMEEVVYNAVDLARRVSSDYIDTPQYILVDEFQDLNVLEQEFIRILGANAKLVLVAGDPDQSIYSFKYAHPDGIRSFSHENGVESHSLAYSGRCSREVIRVANQLLIQLDPTRTSLLRPLLSASQGTVSLVSKYRQEDEFGFVLDSILQRVRQGTEPKEILVLVPRKQLGRDFVQYAHERRLPTGVSLRFAGDNDYSLVEQERILLLGVVAHPDSLLRIRSYAGFPDDDKYADQFRQLKNRYGNVREAIHRANLDDFDRRKTKVRALCLRLQEINRLIAEYENINNVDDVLNRIVPTDNEQLADLRATLEQLREEGDTLKELYSKFLDYSRTQSPMDTSVRVMTIFASKGLDAEHVFIIGCNDGNIPGRNRSTSLMDHEYKQEQKRLLYVGFTRAKESLTVSWSRIIPFSQSLSQDTTSVSTVTIGGEKCSRVGLSEFLQDIRFN